MDNDSFTDVSSITTDNEDDNDTFTTVTDLTYYTHDLFNDDSSDVILDISLTKDEYELINDTSNHAPYWEDEIFRGEINEHGRLEMLPPALVAHDHDEGANGKICHFNILESVPFTASVQTGATGGAGTIEAVSGAINAAVKDCDENREWKFHIQASDCGTPSLPSPTAQVHIVMRDPNNNKPRFLQNSYEATVEEGTVPHKFLQIQAVDDDCSPGFSTICSYDIMTPGMPFKIDIKGKRTLFSFPERSLRFDFKLQDIFSK
ncbi:calsyntenin-1-like [Strongylocentrotus purpuratus]|uniref:Cadherin domain-containing protein n=1 Tax=Strongylocentrotus purpuratus TaxID=7668 RepID=A0A7M7P0E5_STRPU|nr:calsyntenin-1-like [Strongylocentrotus purpuratus]